MLPMSSHHDHPIHDGMLDALELFKANVYQIEILAYLNLMFMVSNLSKLIILRKISRTMDLFSMSVLADSILFTTSVLILQWIYGFNCIFTNHSDAVV